ncbi:MAG: sulfite exporter TauE/SafE family protein [Verrucomicrobia bacterium]|mgnify:FL=1|nr:sulfite exporter TauE/SafE family protein [Verrucomicrobiota bacterium]
MQYLIFSVTGAISGVISGLFGVGGGIIIVPALTYFLNVPIKTAIGSSLAIIIPTALMGAGKHIHQGNIDWKIVLSVAPMAVVGGYAGAWLTQHLEPAHIRKGFAVLMVYVGIQQFFK